MSREGTTQVDPLAMVVFAVASIPLIRELSAAAAVKQLWYVDDATGMGSLHELRKWWDKINVLGESYGYHPNAVKTPLSVRENLYYKACELFKNTNITVKTKDVILLGCPIGTEEFVQDQIKMKISHWCEELNLLTSIAKLQPQATYSAFTHGLQLMGRWTFFFRACSLSKRQISPLEESIRQIFITTLIGRDSVNDLERK